MFSSKQTHKFDYFICYHLESGPRIWVARDQTQPGTFSRERKEPGNEVMVWYVFCLWDMVFSSSFEH